MSWESIFTKDEVLTGGFEAQCVAKNGERYLWHQGYGLRTDALHGRTTLLLSSEWLPEGPWSATAFGWQELGRAGSDGADSGLP